VRGVVGFVEASRVTAESLWALCLWLFLDGASFAFFTTPLLLQYGKLHPPWAVAFAGGAASAAGSVLQLLLLRWALGSGQPWMRRLAPSQEKLADALRRFPSASFLALLLARATPLPDAPLKLVAAAGGYPAPLYAVAIYLGALPYYFALALLGQKLRIPTWVLLAATAAILVGILLDQWRRRVRASR
jgi:uncharacterized membrane protein YdjX (TVP38/TMEM64 family)